MADPYRCAGGPRATSPAGWPSTPSWRSATRPTSADPSPSATDSPHTVHGTEGHQRRRRQIRDRRRETQGGSRGTQSDRGVGRDQLPLSQRSELAHVAEAVGERTMRTSTLQRPLSSRGATRTARGLDTVSAVDVAGPVDPEAVVATRRDSSLLGWAFHLSSPRVADEHVWSREQMPLSCARVPWGWFFGDGGVRCSVFAISWDWLRPWR